MGSVFLLVLLSPVEVIAIIVIVTVTANVIALVWQGEFPSNQAPFQVLYLLEAMLPVPLPTISLGPEIT